MDQGRILVDGVDVRDISRSDLRRLFGQKGRFVVAAVVAGHQGHAGFFHQRFGRTLAAHGGDGRSRRADEDQAVVGTGLGEGFVLAEEAVARVDGLRARGPRGFNDALPLQVAVARRVAAHVYGFIASLHVARVGVGIGINSHGAHTHAARSGGHAAGDFAAVGNQNFFEHGGARLK